LKDLGVRVALDDFGTGYSSLSFLERLPIDILKIDKSFVATIGREGPVGLAPAIIQLAQTLGHAAIAEGVENEVQAVLLREMGCPLGQGYHLGIPLDGRSTGRLLGSDSEGQARRRVTAAPPIKP